MKCPSANQLIFFAAATFGVVQVGYAHGGGDRIFEQMDTNSDGKVSAEHKHDFVAHDQSDNLMASIDTVLHRLEQQLRKYKEKVQERHRNTDARRHEGAGEAEAED